MDRKQHDGAHHEDAEEVQVRVLPELTVGAHRLQAAYQADEGNQQSAADAGE
eukprot:CAMPEP_0183403778 /NCGR_PEP_ID=MMETSP0370-20130417/14802_1 /TAXON_ID=268820 /ORGANISM="Peridinium aciculiferum, Strain PAER-2" /LENGTH=51 /DNA_ID=CAMNT_0025585575 /DNA_START=441 /DNA_END=596 /DNA_ORIENTATION=+